MRILGARHLWLSLLLLVGATAIAVPGLNETNSGGVAMIGSTEYETLQAAFDEAKDGATIQVIKAGEYAIPAITRNLTIEATVNDVVVNHTDNAAITTIASGKTATFKNITFNLGTTALATGHGFGTLNGSNGALVMDGCTINGALNLFGASTLNNCTFNAEGIYNIWAVNDDATFTGCTFNNTNRAVNVYDQKNGTTKKNVSFSNCTFKATGTVKKKAAINIHHNPSHNSCAQYNVSIDNCSTTGDNWASTIEETGEPKPATICNSPLWMVSDIENGAAGDIAVTVNNVAQDLSKIGAVAKIGDKYYTSLAAAVAAAEDDQTVEILKAGEYAIPAITKNLTIEATVNDVVVNHTDNAAITTIASGKTATFKNITFNLGTTALATGHGFGTLNGSNGALEMDGCTINGALNLFGASTFTNCKFNAEGIYNIWAVNDNATFTGCTFTNTNRAVNVYDQKKSSTKKSVSFSGCTFNGSEKRKAAVNIHHNPDPVGTAAKYDVSITNCTTSGTWASTVEETGEPIGSTICYSPLWMISDIVNWEDGDITVTVDGKDQDVSKFSPVAKIGDTKYTSLEAAVDAAVDGATIQVIKAGEYAIPAITKNLTIEGAVEGVAVKHEENSAITTISSGKTATFKNITFDLGTLQKHTAHGFGTLSGSNGALAMDGCTINGALNLFGESTFTNCKFDAKGIYNIWAVNDNATFTGCTFTNTNRAVNVYDQKKSSTKKNVSFSGCTFKGSEKKKAAVNIHHNPDGTAAKYAVSITDCTTSGTWASTVEETGEPDGSTICYSPLWMISDIVNWKDGDITVTVDGKAQDVSKFSPVAKIGETKYTSLQAALDAAEADNPQDIVIDLLGDATLDITAWSGTGNSLAIGTESTKSITINGHDNKLTFIYKNSDWNNVATMNDAVTKLILNDMAITHQLHPKSGGTWNGYDIGFNCAVELNNVTSDKALAFKNDATLNNVTITETHDYYAIWVSARGQSVSINGLDLTSSGRGIKIDDQYVDNPEQVTLDIANATFNTKSKSAILVKSDANTVITVGENVNIENVAADKTNVVWVDEDRAEEFYKVTVNGATVVPEKMETDYVACLMKGEQRWGFYKGTSALSKAIDKVEDGFRIKLFQTTTEAVKVSKQLTITKNGFTADNVTAADGFVREETETEIIIRELDPVAKIGEGENAVKYESLADAFAAAADENTVTLLKDVALTDRLFVNAGAEPTFDKNNRFATTSENKSITLDLSGYNVTTSSNIALAGGSLNIVNKGTADATHGVISTTNAGLAPIEIRGTGDLTQKRTLTVGTGVTLSGAEYGLNVFGSNDEQKNVIDVNVNGTVNGTLFVLGNLKNVENEININVAGTVYGPDNGDDEASVGVALNGIATVNVNEGAQVSGETGIEVRAGNLIVNGGNIKATASTYSEKKNGSGSCTKGAAVAVAQHTTMLPIKATLNGGTLTGTRTLVVTDVEEIGLNDVTVKAADALAKAETVVIPAGYKWVSADGMSTLTPCDYVAQIGEGENIVKYETLAEAVEAATAETTTITLLTDVKEGIVVKDGKNIVLDLNGKTMTGYIDQYDADIVVKNGTVAGTVYVNGAAENTENYNKFTLDATATIITKDYGIILWQSDKNTAYGSTIDINGTINGCVFVMGNIKEGNSVINVNDGATIKGEVGIALNGYATLNVVDGATIEGTIDSGIEVRAGNLNVEGGTITSAAKEYSVNPNGSGTTTTGAAIAIAQHTTGLPINANITGGTLSGPKTISVADPQGLNYTGVVVTAKDELTEKENNVIPDGYIWMSNNNGTSTLTKIEDGEYKLIDTDTRYPFMSLKSDISVSKVTYERTFTSELVDQHQAWYVPMDYTITAEDAENFTFYKLQMIAGAAEAGEADPDKMYLYVTPMNVGETLVGNRPYTVKPKSAVNKYVFKAENTILYAPNNGSRLNVTTSTHSYDFFGQYEKTVYKGKVGDFYVLSGNALHPNDATIKLRPYRWNIKVSKNNINDGYSKIEFVIVEDGDATGINSVRGFNADDVEGIYTINGMKLDEPVKGINIIKYKNGRTEKRIIK